jgi:putative two-component system response regulator
MIGHLQKKRILIVDDEAPNRAILKDMVEMFGHATETACDGLEALGKVKLNVDLVLLDLMMPGLDGFEVIRQIRADAEVSHIPVIIITSRADRVQRLRAIEAGASDFINKPVDALELRLRTTSLLRLKDAYDQVASYTQKLQHIVEDQTSKLREALVHAANAQRDTYKAHIDTIRSLAVAAEYKDEHTAAHIERMSLYTVAIGTRMGLTPKDIELLRYGSIMHDVGKIGIPDAIMLKPGKLTPTEWEVMKKHTTIGARILSNSTSELIKAGEIVALTHHERWDGTGYPSGLIGEQIPLHGRICAVADVFDALTSKRPYKPAFSNDEALETIRESAGSHFDPEIVDAFFNCTDDIFAIQNEHRDADGGESLLTQSLRAVQESMLTTPKESTPAA